MAVLGERLAAAGWAGAGVLAAGLVVVTATTGQTRRHQPGRRRRTGDSDGAARAGTLPIPPADGFDTA